MILTACTGTNSNPDIVTIYKSPSCEDSVFLEGKTICLPELEGFIEISEMTEANELLRQFSTPNFTDLALYVIADDQDPTLNVFSSEFIRLFAPKKQIKKASSEVLEMIHQSTLTNMSRIKDTLNTNYLKEIEINLGESLILRTNETNRRFKSTLLSQKLEKEGKTFERMIFMSIMIVNEKFISLAFYPPNEISISSAFKRGESFVSQVLEANSSGIYHGKSINNPYK